MKELLIKTQLQIIFLFLSLWLNKILSMFSAYDIFSQIQRHLPRKSNPWKFLKYKQIVSHKKSLLSRAVGRKLSYGGGGRREGVVSRVKLLTTMVGRRQRILKLHNLKRLPRGVLLKKNSLKICKIHRKAPVLRPLS